MIGTNDSVVHERIVHKSIDSVVRERFLKMRNILKNMILSFTYDFSKIDSFVRERFIVNSIQWFFRQSDSISNYEKIFSKSKNFMTVTYRSNQLKRSVVKVGKNAAIHVVHRKTPEFFAHLFNKLERHSVGKIRSRERFSISVFRRNRSNSGSEKLPRRVLILMIFRSRLGHVFNFRFCFG